MSDSKKQQRAIAAEVREVVVRPARTIFAEVREMPDTRPKRIRVSYREMHEPPRRIRVKTSTKSTIHRVVGYPGR